MGQVGGQLFEDIILIIGIVCGSMVRGYNGHLQALLNSASEVLIQFFIIRSHRELERSYFTSADQPEEIGCCLRVISCSLVILIAYFVLFVIKFCCFQHNWDEGERVICASIV